eukprot:2055325-Amphidinium_carterae.1
MGSACSVSPDDKTYLLSSYSLIPVIVALCFSRHITPPLKAGAIGPGMTLKAPGALRYRSISCPPKK